MSGFSLEINGNFRELEQIFQRLLSNDKRELLGAIGNAILTATHINFDNEQTPDGQSWEPSRRASLSGGKTLQQDGHLRDSYTYQVNDDYVEVGSNHFSAAIHHFGGEIRPNTANALHFRIGDRWVTASSVTMPARPALGMNDDLEKEIHELTAIWIGDANAGSN